LTNPIYGILSFNEASRKKTYYILLRLEMYFFSYKFQGGLAQLFLALFVHFLLFITVEDVKL